MSNLIQNPRLSDWKHSRYFTDQEGKTGTIELPKHWNFATISRESDPNKLPQSLHRDTGFIISAGYRSWEAGYSQGGLKLEANTRYRLKARIKADVNFPSGQAPDLTAITWRFSVKSSDNLIEQDWAITSKGQTKQVEEFEFVFEVAESLTSEITFWGRSYYAGNDCDFWVYEISLEPVSKDYGASQVPSLGTATVSKPDVSPPKDTKTDEVSLPDIETVRGESGKTLADVISNTEIDTISDGLKSLANNSNNMKINIGLNKLAEVLERLKS